MSVTEDDRSYYLLLFISCAFSAAPAPGCSTAVQLHARWQEKDSYCRSRAVQRHVHLMQPPHTKHSSHSFVHPRLSTASATMCRRIGGHSLRGIECNVHCIPSRFFIPDILCTLLFTPSPSRSQVLNSQRHHCTQRGDVHLLQGNQLYEATCIRVSLLHPEHSLHSLFLPLSLPGAQQPARPRVRGEETGTRGGVPGRADGGVC